MVNTSAFDQTTALLRRHKQPTRSDQSSRAVDAIERVRSLGATRAELEQEFGPALVDQLIHQGFLAQADSGPTATIRPGKRAVVIR